MADETASESLDKLQSAVSESVEGSDDLDLALLFHVLEYEALLTDLTEGDFNLG